MASTKYDLIFCSCLLAFYKLLTVVLKTIPHEQKYSTLSALCSTEPLIIVSDESSLLPILTKMATGSDTLWRVFTSCTPRWSFPPKTWPRGPWERHKLPVSSAFWVILKMADRVGHECFILLKAKCNKSLTYGCQLDYNVSQTGCHVQPKHRSSSTR